MKRPYHNYHLMLNFLIIANLFMAGLLVGCGICLWSILQMMDNNEVVPVPKTSSQPVCYVEKSVLKQDAD